MQTYQQLQGRTLHDAYRTYDAHAYAFMRSDADYTGTFLRMHWLRPCASCVHQAPLAVDMTECVHS